MKFGKREQVGTSGYLAIEIQLLSIDAIEACLQNLSLAFEKPQESNGNCQESSTAPDLPEVPREKPDGVIPPVR